MFSLRRQWHRFQLARELLEQYEYEERERIPWTEIMQRMGAAHSFGHEVSVGAAARWAAAARAKAEQYPSDA